MTSMRKIWRGGRLCFCRCEVTEESSILVIVRKRRQDVLASAPLTVSLLTTRAWMLESQLVGPYTSTMGVMSKIMDGLKNFRKFLTCSVRTSMFSRTCLLAFF
jgi:hypothetical protein